MEIFLLILKNFAFGAGIIIVLTGIFAFIASKFYKGHPHGMPGILTAMAGGLCLVLYLISTIVMVYMGKQDLSLYLWTAFGLVAVLGGGTMVLDGGFI